MKKYCIGVDVGGTSVKIGLFQADGTILDKWEVPTRTDDGGKDILPDTAASILEKLKEKEVAIQDVAGVGVGAPGPIDADGTVHVAVNLGWGVFNIPETMSALLGGIPVKAANDANVAALGEMWKGGGQGYKNLVMVTLGTGVGGGIIQEGRIVSGSAGSGGEIGHIHVKDAETIPCNCKNYGCLEQYTSATGIVRLAKERLAADSRESAIRRENISAKTVFDAVKAGDALAIEVAEEFGEILGKALAGVAGVVNPEVFVIGGGVSRAGRVLFDYIEKNFIKYAFVGCHNAKFELATLGNDAGIYGAARLVLE